jgi:hypothetical protein
MCYELLKLKCSFKVSWCWVRLNLVRGPLIDLLYQSRKMMMMMMMMMNVEQSVK